MSPRHAARRDVLRGVGALGTSGVVAAATATRESTATVVDADRPRGPHVRANFRAVVDAVVPRTPDLAGELGREHVPGGLDVGLDDYLPTFVDTLFSAGVPGAGDVGTLQLSEVVAIALDLGATTLVATGEHESPPSIARVLELVDVDDLLDLRRLADDPETALEESLFAALSRRDRLRAIERLDAVDLDTAVLPGPVAEVDAALLGQLVVGFTEVLYYSEWAGYDDVEAPPSERSLEDDVQGWDQTGFPGVIDGAAALRGYWGRPDGPLGAGATWDVVDADADRPIQLRAEPGTFTEDAYDTSDYAEPFATDGSPATDGPVGHAVDAVTGDAGADDRDDEDGSPVEDLVTGLLGIGDEDGTDSSEVGR